MTIFHKLNYSYSRDKFESEQQNRLLRVVLQALDVDVGNLMVNNILSFDNRESLKNILKTYKISFVTQENIFNIYVEDNVIAKLYPIKYKVKKDISNDKIFLEAEVTIWTVFD
ncbi:MAG: hypothetical protein LC122_13215 [Chitinophagales bacterium]|nr:hypothetical protein [Chitinophagales bacterium]